MNISGHRTYLLAFAGILLSVSLQAQLNLGFYGGLSISNISGPLEQAPEAAGEEFSSLTGFHIGLRGNYELNNWLAVGAGLGYSQKGSAYTYEGPSYFKFQNTRNETFPFFAGSREVDMQINTDHLDIPIFVQFQPFERLQLYGGPYASFTLAARAVGALRFTPVGGPEKEIGVEYNYFSDGLGLDPDIMTQSIIISGEEYSYPLTVGAYYDREEVDGNLINVLDYGLQGGINLFITSGLYLNGEIMYGLNDMTNDDVDISIATRNLIDDDFNYRDDFDRFISYKISLGFDF